MDVQDIPSLPSCEVDEVLCNNDNEIITDEVAEQDEVVPAPVVGMVFGSCKEAHKYYLKYARREGFSVRLRGNRHGDDGQVLYSAFVCSRGKRGEKKVHTAGEKPKAVTSKDTFCKARIRIKRKADGEYIISLVQLEHNHLLGPQESIRFRQNRRRNLFAQRHSEFNNEARVWMNKNDFSCPNQQGSYGQIDFFQKGADDFIDQERKLRLEQGDAQALQSFFVNMHRRNHDFFYDIDYDDKNRIRNIFWADARSRAAYEAFGDVVMFDTTCLTNKYEMPLALFVGVNHHGQSILLGCGLLSNEDTRTFAWLFGRWKECMHGVDPPAIITDQCRAMKSAIELVFPRTKHRWCLWHIMQKVSNISGKHADYGAIEKQLDKALYDTLRIEEFDHQWKAMFEEHFPEGNKWLESLYEERAHWVPVYLKGWFWAGMSTTQRSERVDFFFNGYVDPRTSLKFFIERYDKAMIDKVEEEFVADFNSFSTSLQTLTSYPIERQFQVCYTKAKFKEFQEEFRAKMYCKLLFQKNVVNEDEAVQKYVVNEDVFHEGAFIGSFSPMVHVNLDGSEIICECRLFESRGILCRHALLVYHQCGIVEVPSKYILPRWSKDVKRKYNFIKSCYQDSNGKLKELESICSLFFDIVSIGESDGDVLKLVRDGLETVKEKVLNHKSVFAGQSKK